MKRNKMNNLVVGRKGFAALALMLMSLNMYGNNNKSDVYPGATLSESNVGVSMEKTSGNKVAESLLGLGAVAFFVWLTGPNYKSYKERQR